MMITVVAHFTKGEAEPFPELLNGIAEEGSVHTNEQISQGGVIVVSFDTDDDNLVREAFAMQRVGGLEFFYSKTKTHIF